MKPILPYSILLSIAISPLALATDYGQLLNKNLTYSGDIAVSASTNIDTTGSVQVSAASGTTTTNLNGNVSITNTGKSGDHGGSGIYVAGAGTNTVNVTATEGALGKDVVITTNKDAWGAGVFTYSATATINVDAKDHNIIVQKTTGSASGGGTGVYADNGGNINLTANEVHVKFDSLIQSYAVWASNNSKINITTNTLYANAGHYSVSAADNATVSVSGNLVANTSNANYAAMITQGTYASATEAIKIGGHTTLTGSIKHGVYAHATNATISLNGGLTNKGATIAAGGYAIYADAAGAVVTDNAAANVGTLYEITGGISTANATAKIDLHMGATSTFTGYTTKTSGTLNLALAVSAEWALATANSSLTSLSVTQGSALTIASGNTFLITASEGITLGSGSYINMSDARANMDGTVLTLFDTASTVTDGTNVKVVGLVGDQWYSYDYTYSETTKKYTIGSSKSAIDVPEFRGGVTPIPEPTTASLTLLGLASLMMRRRRLTA